MTTDEFLEVLRADVLEAAPLLLGWRIVRGERMARIVEVEAYRSDDPASHSYQKTKMKNMAMFGPPGNAYVYFNYGVHWMLNMVAHDTGQAAAILIRAAEPLAGLVTFRALRAKAKRDLDLLSGPGKLAAGFEITAKENGSMLIGPDSMMNAIHFIPPDMVCSRAVAGARIGIAVGKGHEKPWRFADGDRLEWVSRPLTF